MKSATAPVLTFPTQAQPDNLSPSQAAAWVGYKDKKSFLKTARATGLRVMEINARVLRVDFRELQAWRSRRTA